ncbi:hypothetical protein ARMSODRAFT_516874 [Armillaria solidipes]|uniref:Secreted protein n=1 Tax=Armillaria solidipes TaxID=1076256 RepID=A0A2H3AZF8_9AGAR|nr:hypothetical protein ARMSODRAFT_516874 [Armillaria solidipes]
MIFGLLVSLHAAITCVARLCIGASISIAAWKSLDHRRVTAKSLVVVVADGFRCRLFSRRRTKDTMWTDPFWCESQTMEERYIASMA